ncbi:Protein of unknown function (DUF3888) [Schinkia azotoformans MEV2011]|uniref:DUF3888 domain-containing protein n=1 Tax=Schinkia azotoformans MEV2011 TaxID=1348973 RepID=A0A072NHH9_SCHAZ|nr:DUF3888 domain-containing protein [Schinkia azotoformans]KEF36378.1 Protein of unknown function (DUF3888) [Schinkia azotoformans MEV2011]MEC1697318.1 DUF3888 domain-containing protein [Schinkia azotoformans]MEC1716262.1 DUF3888 domain-containing protein [Schinkia azotoformans]MEC1724598.1 DUF3888 domain-containing protein [Schinkia azotoformans]MEC1741639.1 DUF3888 domain-containing protein [Schinkia azotoformans]
MRKVIMISCLITFIAITPVQAETNDKHYEMMLEDIIYSFLSPLESKAIEDYFGEIHLSDFCKFVEVKTKPDQAYRYEITYQFITYERAIMPPYHLFTLKVENKSPTDWVIKEVKVRELAENNYTKMCRKPRIVW